MVTYDDGDGSDGQREIASCGTTSRTLPTRLPLGTLLLGGRQKRCGKKAEKDADSDEH